jgi:hypothetical protein
MASEPTFLLEARPWRQDAGIGENKVKVERGRTSYCIERRRPVGISQAFKDIDQKQKELKKWWASGCDRQKIGPKC